MQEVIKSVSIENMVNQRAGVVERLRQAFDLIAEAETLAKTAHIGFPRLVIDHSFAIRGGRSVDISGSTWSKRDDAEKAAIRVIDADGWNYLLNESGLRTFMDAGTRDKWQTQMSEGELPELTADNVKATFAQLYNARGDMFEAGVIKTFQRLSWNYKTNQPFLFGKRIIMSYFFTYGSPGHRGLDELTDLMRVFHVLDGKPEPDHRQGIHSAIWDAYHRRETALENAYVKVKWFKNGNAHITFLRPDLVRKMNDILAKHYPDALAADH